MSYTRLGISLVDVNPLTGQPLESGQVLLTSPDGRRVSVVWLDRRVPWPRWVTLGPHGGPWDDGTIPGGVLTGPQQLPELNVIGYRIPPWLILAGLFLLLWWLSNGRGRRGDW